jgi:flagellar hook-associated protein FlgK
MNPIASIALSGLQAAQTRMGSAAHNIANAATPDFRRRVVVPHSVAGGGVATQIERAPVAGDALAEDLVALKYSVHLFSANLAVLRTHDRLLGTLLDAHA